jgi:hypothetical protein
VAWCFEQDRDQWRGVKNRTETRGGVLRTRQRPGAGSYEQDRDQWLGVMNRRETSGRVL